MELFVCSAITGANSNKMDSMHTKQLDRTTKLGKQLENIGKNPRSYNIKISDA